MISNVTAGAPAKVALDAPAGFTGVSAVWDLFDEDGEKLTSGTVADFDAQSSKIVVSLSSTDTALADGLFNAGREIVVTVTDATGDEVEVRDYFVVVAPHPLTFPGNTFLSYPAALALRGTFGPTLAGWDRTLDHSARQAALIHAHANLSRVRYNVGLPVGGSEKDYAAYGEGTDFFFDALERVSLFGITAERFNALPAHFTRAITRAQLVEADVLLGGDLVGQKRKDGIISETIGESSTFFSSKPYLTLPFSRQAYELLKPYVRIRVSISR